MSGSFKSLISLALVLLLVRLAVAASPTPVWSTEGLAATPHWTATAAAVEILREGGNAVDAVVAASFALAVVEPYHSGLGGGEFTLLWLRSDGRVRALDARESAPLESNADMFVKAKAIKGESFKSWDGGLAVGVPGSVAGRVELITKYGKLPLKTVLAPAIRLAREGFKLDESLSERIRSDVDFFAENADLAKVFLKDGHPYRRGEVLKQPALADALTQIARDRGESFYRGTAAESIARACKGAGGILTEFDLAAYKLKWREPIVFDYRGCQIYSMPPPSSGGVALAEILNILSGFPFSYVEPGSAESYHLLASAFERAFADRGVWLGDSDYNPIPVEGLTSRRYAEKLRQQIDRRIRNEVKGAGDPWIFSDEGNTSHLSAIDRHGNMCAMTTSVNTAFGSRVFVPELGIFLNSTMDDFNTLPDERNHFGLERGGDVNLVESGKRPLSSMSPTLVFKDGQPYLSLGSVGGPRIITSVAQILVNIIDHGMNVQEALDQPRIHHQWKPDKLYLEREIPAEVSDELRRRGWILDRAGHWSLSQAVMFDAAKGEFFGASDSRGVGSAGPASDR